MRPDPLHVRVDRERQAGVGGLAEQQQQAVGLGVILVHVVVVAPDQQPQGVPQRDLQLRPERAELDPHEAKLPVEDHVPQVLLQWTENADGPPLEATDDWPEDHDIVQGERYTRVRITRRPHDPTIPVRVFDSIGSSSCIEGRFVDKELGDFGIFTYEVVGFWRPAGVNGPADSPECETVASQVTVAVVPQPMVAQSETIAMKPKMRMADRAPSVL